MILPLYKTIIDTLDVKIEELQVKIESEQHLTPLRTGLKAGRTKLFLHFKKAFRSPFILLGAGNLFTTF
jgi:hypothetical protein